jgi:hypothetical protein
MAHQADQEVVVVLQGFVVVELPEPSMPEVAEAVDIADAVVAFAIVVVMEAQTTGYHSCIRVAQPLGAQQAVCDESHTAPEGEAISDPVHLDFQLEVAGEELSRTVTCG